MFSFFLVKGFSIWFGSKLESERENLEQGILSI